LVTTEEDLSARDGQSTLAAYPVVPCTGMREGRAATAHAREHREGRANGQADKRVRPAPVDAARLWFVTLQNGEQVKLDKDTMIIGRSRTCDVIIPSAKVSRQHASLTRVGEDYYIEDLGSANGVWIRGEKITRVKVSNGDQFTISDETLTFDQR
jgi:hypothetical protein